MIEQLFDWITSDRSRDLHSNLSSHIHSKIDHSFPGDHHPKTATIGRHTTAAALMSVMFIDFTLSPTTYDD